MLVVVIKQHWPYEATDCFTICSETLSHRFWANRPLLHLVLFLNRQIGEIIYISTWGLHFELSSSQRAMILLFLKIIFHIAQ